MSIELGKLLLDDETAEAFSAWLHCLVDKRRRETRLAEEEQRRDERESAWGVRLVAIARAAAERHGLLEDMNAWEQAKAACASWEAQAGYFDVDEHFAMDDDYRELYHNSYCNRIREIERSRTS